MGLKTEKRTIEGMEVSVTQLPPRKAFKLMPKLAGVLGPLIGKARGGDQGAMLEGVGASLMQLDDVMVDNITAQLFSQVMVIVDLGNGLKNYDLSQTTAVDQVFAGNLKAMMQTLTFAVEVNYSDFFKDALAQVQVSGAIDPKVNQ
jgi:hypothetical protein